ncbi:MAG TPA: bifunctional phosphoglucose/phosphomannose isomerase [Actinomycetota bacterium]|nr:bifunctional phosphoglucose/phosphomannose isomerase [Actinomycetota bacterium]
MRTDLDNAETFEQLDSLGVLGAVENFADQCADGWELGLNAAGLPLADGLEQVVVLGMGGSGFSGDVVRVVAEPRLFLPLRVIKSYGPLPEWVGRNTLVCAASYSGNTEETLDAFAGAHERGARLVALSSGGQLADAAAAYGCTHIRVPAGGQPRASLGYLAMPLLGALTAIEVVPDLRAEVEEMLGVVADICARSHRKVPLSENPAKQLARIISSRVPVYYGGAGIPATAAYRAKCDVNEYAKQPAFWNEIPEMGHNEIVGWDLLPDVTRENFVSLFLRDHGEDERISKRMDITRRMVRGNVADALEVWSEGTGVLARLFYLVTVTQMSAIYTAFLNGVDPGPVAAIDRLKAELADEQHEGAGT